VGANQSRVSMRNNKTRGESAKPSPRNFIFATRCSSFRRSSHPCCRGCHLVIPSCRFRPIHPSRRSVRHCRNRSLSCHRFHRCCHLKIRSHHRIRRSYRPGRRSFRPDLPSCLRSRNHQILQSRRSNRPIHRSIRCLSRRHSSRRYGRFQRPNYHRCRRIRRRLTPSFRNRRPFRRYPIRCRQIRCCRSRCCQTRCPNFCPSCRFPDSSRPRSVSRGSDSDSGLYPVPLDSPSFGKPHKRMTYADESRVSRTVLSAEIRASF
jgi:hypothetical protein